LVINIQSIHDARSEKHQVLLPVNSGRRVNTSTTA